MEPDMKIRTAFFALLAVAGAAPILAQAACSDTFANGTCIHGEPANSTAAARTVDLSTTRQISAAYGETIKFVDGDKSFAWTFDGLGEHAVPLSRIAPSDIKAGSATVYVASSAESQD
jgi:hypothetical protein